MISYRDKTFCNSPLCCNYDCPIKLTEKIIQDADDFGLPIAMADRSSGCIDFISVEVGYENY